MVAHMRGMNIKMKITKAQLQKIIKEELAQVSEAGKLPPKYLLQSWVKELDKWVRAQFDPKYPLEQSEEGPAIVAALRQVADTLEGAAGSAEAPGGAGPGGGERTPWGGEQAFKRDY